MSKVIICIHGRSNKPKLDVLLQGWSEAINEGLGHSTTTRLANTQVEIAYYADIHYPIADNENEESYKKAKTNAIKPYNSGIMDRIRGMAGNWLDTPLDWLEKHSGLFSTLGREVSNRLLEDLGEYYSKIEIREKVNNRLKSLLLEHKDDEIILVSHSMGTIVAYEVLRELGRSEEHKGFVLEHFVTMGAPLGLSIVKGNAAGVHGKLRTPSCVRGSWLNFSDPQDFVCIDSHLIDDYAANSFSVKVKDVMVCNDYPNNEHKSYGYLRTPEFSSHLASLL